MDLESTNLGVTGYARLFPPQLVRTNCVLSLPHYLAKHIMNLEPPSDANNHGSHS